jgi:guanylate kinase
VFVDRPTFESHVETGGFFEWAEFLGNLYGTPVPAVEAEGDVLLEIDLQGALQVRTRRPDATLILLLPPSTEAQAARLRARGDEESSVAERLRTGEEEARRGRSIADAVVVNHHVDQATAEVAGIVEGRRLAAGRSPRVG